MVPFRRSVAALFMALVLVGSLAGGLWPAAQAQTSYEEDSYAPAGGDPPEQVGRVSLLTGTVSWRETAEGQWAPAVLNYPVSGGNAFWTEPGARAELRMGDDSIRLDGSTQLDIQQLDGLVLRVAVPQGIINLHVQTRDPNEVYQVVTPRGAVNLAASGTYRIDAGTEATPTAVAVLRGSARFVGDHALTIVTGETVLVAGNGQVSYTVQRTVPTEFDNWSLARDNYEEPRQVAQYVSPDMTGYEDLGAYGEWQATPEYGNVWYPTAVPVGWAPYRYGHWAWILPWGWTWVDDAPWGFAPFHYGRWFYSHDRWGWWPGERHHRPVFAPALVAFVGGHDHRFGIGLGGPAIGWVPLAPHEAFHPYFHASQRFERDVNINAVRNINATNATAPNVGRANFANRGFATVVPQDAFTGGHHVGRAALHVPTENLAAAPIATGSALPVGHGRPAEARSAVPIPNPTTTTRRFEGRPGKQFLPERERVITPQPSSSSVTPVPNVQREAAPVSAPTTTGLTKGQRFEGRPGKQFLPERERVITPPLAGTTVYSPQRETGEPSVPRIGLTTGATLQAAPAPHPLERRETVTPQPQADERREIMAPPTRSNERRETVVPQATQQTSDPREVSAPQPRPMERERREVVVPQQQQPVIERGGEAPTQAPPAREMQQVRPPPHEITVPHPEQSRVMTPSREGWVRQAPPVSAPSVQPAPAAAPRAQPAPAARAPDIEQQRAPAVEERRSGGEQRGGGGQGGDQRNDQGNDRRGGGRQ